jgi:hypothetical protein
MVPGSLSVVVSSADRSMALIGSGGGTSLSMCETVSRFAFATGRVDAADSFESIAGAGGSVS